MVTCELIPLCPDTEVHSSVEPVVTEPVEIGPYLEGVVFIKIMNISDSATIKAEVGISPYGYEDWDEHWTTLDTLEIGDKGMHAFPIENFGGWIRLRLASDESTENIRLQAWFTGKG